MDERVLITVAPGDVGAMTSAIAEMLERLRAQPAGTRALARSQAGRHFAPDVVCRQISGALQGLLARRGGAPVPLDGRAASETR